MAATCKITCHGHLEAADLLDVDLESLARKILADEIGRPEFFVEILDGATLLGTVLAGPLYTVDSNAPADRWCLTFSEPNEHGRWCLSAAKSLGTYEWYVFCGGETEILDSCALPLSAVLDAVRKCCEERGRAQSLQWIEMLQAMNL